MPWLMPGSDPYRRVEVITGQRRRRQWTGEEKARIVPASFEEGANISEVARRNSVARGLLMVWRRQVAVVAGQGIHLDRATLAGTEIATMIAGSLPFCEQKSRAVAANDGDKARRTSNPEIR
jgi:hypothetical protein